MDSGGSRLALLRRSHYLAARRVLDDVRAQCLVVSVYAQRDSVDRRSQSGVFRQKCRFCLPSISLRVAMRPTTSHMPRILGWAALRSANWPSEEQKIAELTGAISEAVSGNSAITSIGAQLASCWSALHKGGWYTNPRVTFGRSQLDNLLQCTDPLHWSNCPKRKPLGLRILSRVVGSTISRILRIQRSDLTAASR